MTERDHLMRYIKNHLDGLRYAENRDSATFCFAYCCGVVSALWMTGAISFDEQERLRDLIGNALTHARRDIDLALAARH